MKVSFIYPDLQVNLPWWKGYYHTAIGSLIAQLKAAGHKVNLIHITSPEYSKQDLLNDLNNNPPDLIAFSATTLMFQWVEKYTEWLYEEKIKIPTICGGVHPTIDPERAIQTPHLDMICIAEGEDALLELALAIEKGNPYHHIQNLWVKHEGNIFRNPIRPRIQNLDTLVQPDREEWKNFPYLFRERNGYAAVMASRGCPYKCTYCINHIYMKLLPDKKFVRFKSVDKVIEELKYIVNTYPFIHGFVFDDDILYMHKEWAEEFTEKYKKELGLPFECNMRANICNAEIVNLLKEAGCKIVKIGIESGNEYIRNTILKRNLTKEQMSNAFYLCNKAGLKTGAFNMIGLPFETPAMVLETIKFNAACNASFVQASVFYPFPGTDLLTLCEEKGFVKAFKGDIQDFFNTSILTLDTMTKEQIFSYRLSFQLLFFLYKVIYKMEPLTGKYPEKILDAICISKYFSYLADYVFQPFRQIYRYFIRPLLKFCKRVLVTVQG